MSEKTITAIKALAKGEKATIPMMRFGDFPLFMAAVKREQRR